jgi:capsular polysaccharide biosynthesis protein
MTVLLLAAGLAAVLLWIGILELLDTSFKSERQIARILRLPVLGTVPNVFRLSEEISIKA